MQNVNENSTDEQFVRFNLIETFVKFKKLKFFALLISMFFRFLNDVKSIIYYINSRRALCCVGLDNFYVYEKYSTINQVLEVV